MYIRNPISGFEQHVQLGIVNITLSPTHVREWVTSR